MKEKLSKIFFILIILIACFPQISSWMALLAGITYAFIFGGPAYPNLLKRLRNTFSKDALLG